MAYIGASPPASALTASDITDGIISEAKMANDAISLAELKAGTDGELITWDASANPAAVAAGTSGHFLKSQGAGSVPVFAAGGGAWNLLSTTTASNDNTVDIETNDLDSTYANYALVYHDVHPTDDGVSSAIRLSVGGTYATGSYRYAMLGFRDTPSTSNDRSQSAALIYLTGFGIGNATGEVTHGIIYLFNPSGTAHSKMIRGHCAQIDGSGQVILTTVVGTNATQTAVDGIQFYFSAGDVESGVFKLYGIS